MSRASRKLYVLERTTPISLKQEAEIVWSLFSLAIMFSLCGGGHDKINIRVMGIQTTTKEKIASGSYTSCLHSFPQQTMKFYQKPKTCM